MGLKHKGICTSMWCWWCCHECAENPLSMPYGYDERTFKFSVCGHFCSWSCMKAYAIDKYGVNRGSIICGNMVMMRRKMFNKLGGIKMAPNRHRLKQFGGDLTIEQFRENIDKDVTTPIAIHTEQCKQVVVANTKKFNEIKNSVTTNDALRIKRNKPLPRERNNLESALGLIIN